MLASWSRPSPPGFLPIIQAQCVVSQLKKKIAKGSAGVCESPSVFGLRHGLPEQNDLGEAILGGREVAATAGSPQPEGTVKSAANSQVLVDCL